MISLKPGVFPKEQIKDVQSVPKIFLGGTIDMGNSEDWQSNLEKNLAEEPGVIFNPRRDDWDSSWEQTPWPGTQFYEQVDWELKAQEESNIIVYVLLPESKSPITLLEIGLFARSTNKTILVVCPEKFYRYGNVRIVSELYGMKWFDNIEDMLHVLKIHISEWKYQQAGRFISKWPESAYAPELQKEDKVIDEHADDNVSGDET